MHVLDTCHGEPRFRTRFDLSAADINGFSHALLPDKDEPGILWCARSCGTLRIEWRVGDQHAVEDDGKFTGHSHQSAPASLGSHQFETPGFEI